MGFWEGIGRTLKAAGSNLISGVKNSVGVFFQSDEEKEAIRKNWERIQAEKAKSPEKTSWEVVVDSGKVVLGITTGQYEQMQKNYKATGDPLTPDPRDQMYTKEAGAGMMILAFFVILALFRGR